MLCTGLSSCETEAEKQARIRQQEANKIVLTQEEFATLKEYSKQRHNVVEIGESRVISDDKVGGNQACEPLALDDLLELYHIGKKRDWLVDHEFEVNYFFALQQQNEMKYEDVKADHFIGYGRCYYKDAIRARRVGLRVTHKRHQAVYYQTTFKDNFDQMKSELESKGAEKLSGNFYKYGEVPIEFREDVGGRRDEPILYEVVLKSTYSRLDDLSSDQLKEIKDALNNQ